MTIVQIRGSHGSGKSTAVRQLLKNDGYEQKNIKVRGRDICVYENAAGCVVLGKYGESSTGGIDGYITDKNFLKEAIATAIKELKPTVLYFEGVMYGKTFQFSYEVSKYATAKGYTYIALTFVPPLQETIERINKRNGGKPIDIDALQKTYFSVINSTKKLEKAHVKVVWVDTGKQEEGEMWKILKIAK